LPIIPGIGGRFVPPEVDPNDTPDWHVCFRVEWLDFVLGALGTLLDSNIFLNADETGNMFATERANNLINLFMVDCPPVGPVSPNWLMENTALSLDTFLEFNEQNTVVPDSDERITTGQVQRGTILDIAPDVTFSGMASGDVVGGTWQEFTVADTLNAPRVWTMEVTDCFDAVTTTSGLDAIVTGSFENTKSIRIIFDTPSAFDFTIRHRGPWICGPA